MEQDLQSDVCLAENDGISQGEPQCQCEEEKADQAGPAEESELVRALLLPFNDTPRRFWEKAAAFWGLGLVGVAAAAVITWLGWLAFGPILSCGIACGLTAGLVASHATAESRPRPRGVPMVLLPATLAATMLCALVLGAAHQLLFLPSTGRIVAVSATCYFGLYCVASFVAPVGAFGPPAQWPGAVCEIIANWHKAAGIIILSFLYLLVSVPAALVISAAPEFFEAKLVRLSENPLWRWLVSFAGVCSLASARARDGKLSPALGLGRIFSLAWQRCAILLATLPAIIIGSWYTISTSASYMLAQLSHTGLAALEKE